MLQILCIGGAFFPFYSVYQNLAIGRGRSDINMWCNILQIVIQIALLLLCYRWGIIGMVAVYSAFNIVWLLAWQTQIHRLIGLRLWDVLKDIVPFMIIALAVMALTGWLTAGIASNLVLLLTRVAVAGVLYVGIMKLARVQILDECIAFVMKKINKH
jgi:O-antigen/teichoic acid export membrane protein